MVKNSIDVYCSECTIHNQYAANSDNGYLIYEQKTIQDLDNATTILQGRSLQIEIEHKIKTRNIYLI